MTYEDIKDIFSKKAKKSISDIMFAKTISLNADIFDHVQIEINV